MAPTFKEGDWVYIWKKQQEIKRGSIVLVSHPTMPDHKMIRRVVALPGEVIDIYKRRIYIDSQPLQTKWELEAQKSYSQTANEEKSRYRLFTPLQLQKNEIFVLADNRKQELDSRLLGPLQTKQVHGFIYEK